MAEIEVSYIKQFGPNVRLTLQKTTSLLRPSVRVDTDVKGEGYRPETTVGRANYKQRLTRNEDMTVEELPMGARWVEPFDWDVGPFSEDKLDRIRNGMQLEGTYVEAAASAIRRAEDDIILDAIFGSAKTGKNGTGTAATFDTTNMRVTSGSAGLTVNKVIDLRKKFKKKHVDLRVETINIAHTEIQEGDLLKDIQATSSEFVSNKPIESAEINRILKCNLVGFSSEDFDYTASSERRCPAWVKSGVLLADYDLMDPQVYQVKTKRGHPWWIYAMFTLGATRLDEFKVGEILCAES